MARVLSNTDEQYYQNPDFYGEGQFITLKDVLDNLEMSLTDDDFLKKINRVRASIIAKQAIKRMFVDINPENESILVEISPVKTFPFPRQMVNWHRVSMLSDCGKLIPLAINNNPVSQAYLQDHTYELFYDKNGMVVTSNARDFSYGECLSEYRCDEYDCYKLIVDKQTTPAENKELWVKPDRKRNLFVFSDALEGQIVSIEYRSSGLNSLDDSEILIHHDLELTLTNWIIWNLLKFKRNVPQYIRNDAERLYKIEKKRSKKLLRKKISINQILYKISLKNR